MAMYFPRYLIASTMTTCSAVVMKFLWKYTQYKEKQRLDILNNLRNISKLHDN